MKKGQFYQGEPVTIVVHEKETPGVPGKLRKLNGDKAIYTFLTAWAGWLRNPTGVDASSMRQAFLKASAHWPATFVFIPLDSEAEKTILVRQVQTMEDYRQKELDYAAGGWQTCCILARSRTVLGTSGGGSETTDAIEDLLAQVNYAATSEYKISKKEGAKKRKPNRMTTDLLRFYDSVIWADALEVMNKVTTVYSRCV